MARQANQENAEAGRRVNCAGVMGNTFHALAGPFTDPNGTVRSILIMFLLTVVAAGVAASDNRSAVLRIGATIPPAPCQYPLRCKPAPRNTVTSMSVRNGVIRYVGSPPRVETKGDLVTITF